MRHALKEWMIVVDALTRGEQIILFRKGGLRDGGGSFTVEHDRFWLFPTRYHAQADRVVPAAAERCRALLTDPAPETVTLSAWAEVTDTRPLTSFLEIERLAGQHIWRDEALRSRFEFGDESGVLLLLLRVHRLVEPVTLPLLPAYEGCRSWIELEGAVPDPLPNPVLDADAYRAAAARVHSAL